MFFATREWQSSKSELGVYFARLGGGGRTLPWNPVPVPHPCREKWTVQIEEPSNATSVSLLFFALSFLVFLRCFLLFLCVRRWISFARPITLSTTIAALRTSSRSFCSRYDPVALALCSDWSDLWVYSWGHFLGFVWYDLSPRLSLQFGLIWDFMVSTIWVVCPRDDLVSWPLFNLVWLESSQVPLCRVSLVISTLFSFLYFASVGPSKRSPP